MIREFLKLLNKDNLQVQALSECYEMLDMCQKMVDSSVQSLRERDDATRRLQDDGVARVRALDPRLTPDATEEVVRVRHLRGGCIGLGGDRDEPVRSAQHERATVHHRDDVERLRVLALAA